MMKRLFALLAAVALVLAFGAPPASAGGTNRFSDVSPAYGGARIDGPIGNCTSGFMLGWGAYAFSMVPDHCGHGTWYAGLSGREWGVTSQTYWQSDSVNDLQLVTSVLSGDNGVFCDPTCSSRGVYSWETTPQDYVGMPVCMSGSYSKEVCGLPIYTTNATVTYAGTGRVLHNQEIVTCPTATDCAGTDGDSGAPVYTVCTHSPCTQEVEAIGMETSSGIINIGGVNHWEYSFDPIRFIMAALQAYDPGMNVLCDLCSHS